MGQTAEDIRDNIVKITNENGSCVGTGFFIHKEYCVTCHHNICRLDEIYIEREQDNIETGQQQRKRKYHAEWVEEFSDMQKDIAFLKVKGANFKPLEYGRETYGKMPVVVRGFPLEDLSHHPDGKDERGALSDIVVRFLWEEEEIEEKRKKWNVKPKVNVQVYAFGANFSGKFDLGFSGAPVCYEHDWKVVGIFEAKDASKGYIIPMKLVVEKFSLEKTSEVSVSAPARTLHTEKIMNVGNEYFYKEEYAKAIEQYDIILSDPNYTIALSNKGFALRYMGKYKEAIKCYDKAIEIERNDAYAWKGKGSVLRTLGRYEEAIKCYDKAIEINPNYADPWSSKGVTFHILRRYEEAIKCYDKAIEIEQEYAHAWFHRARSKVRKGDIKNGLLDLKKAIEIDKNYIESAKRMTAFESIRNDEEFKALVTK